MDQPKRFWVQAATIRKAACWHTVDLFRRRWYVLAYGVLLFSNSKIADRDGTIDMVFATCSSVSRSTGLGNDCYVNVAYNKQLPLCSSTTSPRFRNDQRVCRAPEELCIADPNFTFDLGDRAGNDVSSQIRNCNDSHS